MILQGRDGELRIIEKGPYGGAPVRRGVTHYLEVLFCGMDFSAPLERPKVEERLILNRNTFDSDAHYVQGSDDVKLAPLSMTFSCMIDDKSQSQTMSDWLSGATQVYSATQSGLTRIYSWDGKTLIGPTTGSGISVPAFYDATKQSYRVEIKWDGSTDYGVQYEEVYFPPDQQTITESEDGLSISGNALIYGGVSRITGFTSGYTKA